MFCLVKSHRFLSTQLKCKESVAKKGPLLFTNAFAQLYGSRSNVSGSSLTGQAQRAGAGDGGQCVCGHTFIEAGISLVGLHDHEELPAIWMRDQADPVVHLHWFSVCKSGGTRGYSGLKMHR